LIRIALVEALELSRLVTIQKKLENLSPRASGQGLAQ
jgi:hypothetical protein